MTRTREAACVLVTAAVTMVIATVALWPLRLNAGDQSTALRVVKPKMTVGAVQYTIEATQLPADSGAKPSVTLKVLNTGAAAADGEVWLMASATGPDSRMSRAPALPRTFWSHECGIHLAAGAAQILTVPIGAPLPQGESVTISMSDKMPVVATKRVLKQGHADAEVAQSNAPNVPK